MTEEFIHYLWRYQLLDRPWYTDSGELIEVVAQGTKNEDAGPDFLDARIRIGDTLWAGDVEIHVAASDWLHHGHEADRLYDGVILHVVHEPDTVIRRKNGLPIPMLVVDGIYDPAGYDLYERFLSSIGWVSCEKLLPEVKQEQCRDWIAYLAGERLQRKSVWVDELFSANHGHAEQTLYHCLAIGFGLKVNADPFEWLAKSIDLKIILKLQPDLSLLEALCFGQAGFLEEDFTDPYPLQLKEQYSFLKGKYGLCPLPVHVWKFLRMRPSGFPTLRLAHWAVFLHRQADKLSRISKMDNGKDLFELFEQESSEYWWNHYHFGSKASVWSKKLGTDTILAIILNSILPYRYISSVRKGELHGLNATLDVMRTLPPECNALTRKWEERGFSSGNALESQGLLELKSQYCDRKKCLDCFIGKGLMKGNYHIICDIKF